MEPLALQLALRQYGLLGRRQARALGLSEGAFRGLTKAGGWEFVLPGVIRAPGSPEKWPQSLMAACLWGGPGAAASHRAAAALWSLTGFPPGPVEITSP